jgi:hypothetical protein
MATSVLSYMRAREEVSWQKAEELLKSETGIITAASLATTKVA